MAEITSGNLTVLVLSNTEAVALETLLVAALGRLTLEREIVFHGEEILRSMSE